MDVVHGDVEESVGLVHLLEREVGEEAAAHDEEGVHRGEGVHDHAKQNGCLELRKGDCA